MQVEVSVTNMWGKLFVVIMQVGVSVTVMQVVFSAVHYAHDCFYRRVLYRRVFLL